MPKTRPKPHPEPSAFDKFVRRIAAVPKAKVDALESAEQESQKRDGDNAKTKEAAS